MHTETFDDLPGESEVTTVLVEQNGKTPMDSNHLVYVGRNTGCCVHVGHEHGAAESYDRLAELPASLSVAIGLHDKAETYQHRVSDGALFIRKRQDKLQRSAASQDGTDQTAGILFGARD